MSVRGSSNTAPEIARTVPAETKVTIPKTPAPLKAKKAKTEMILLSLAICRVPCLEKLEATCNSLIAFL